MSIEQIQVLYLQEPDIMTNEHGQIQIGNSQDWVDDVYHAVHRLNVRADDARLDVPALYPGLCKHKENIRK